MLASLLLAAGAALAPSGSVEAGVQQAVEQVSGVAVEAPAESPSGSASTPQDVRGRARRPMPSGSTQPMTTTPRPSIGFLSADALRTRCESNAPGLVSYCFAYIVGVHDTVQAYEMWLRVREFCPPYNSSQGEIRQAFLSYLQKHPDAGAGVAASVIVLALKDAFVCADQAADNSKPSVK